MEVGGKMRPKVDVCLSTQTLAWLHLSANILLRTRDLESHIRPFRIPHQALGVDYLDWPYRFSPLSE